MIRLYCNANHKPADEETMCANCQDLCDYAAKRIEHCPRMDSKTFCSVCPSNCYQAEMREKIRVVMRFAGPRMLFYAPMIALRHDWITFRELIRRRNKQ